MTGAPLQLRVADVEDVADRVKAYRLVAAEDGTLPPFAAGAHISLHLPSGLARDYSLCSDPADPVWRIAVLRDDAGRGGSREVHEWLAPGVILTASGPRNHFALPDGQGPVLLLAGGIGITPMMPMIHELRRAGRPFRLVYLARSAAQAPFAADLVPIAAEDMTIHLRDRAGARCDLAALLSGLGPLWSVMCCGPLGMIEEVETITGGLDWAPGRLIREVFRAAEPSPQSGDRAITVTIASTGQDIEVAPGQTILDALLTAGIDVDYSCGDGTCGTCITRLLAGTPDHRDMVLMPHEQADHLVVCCSRAKTPGLTLDL